MWEHAGRATLDEDCGDLGTSGGISGFRDWGIEGFGFRAWGNEGSWGFKVVGFGGLEFEVR